MTRDVLEAWESDNEAAEAGGGLQGGSGASPLSRLVLPSGGRRRPGRRGAPRLVPPLQLGRDLLGGGERPRPGPVGGARCGAAAASGRPEVVADVTADPRYLACFPSTRAEIVVPIVRDGQVVGEIDIDGDEVGAFGAEDLSFLESVARLLAPLAQGGSRGHAD